MPPRKKNIAHPSISEAEWEVMKVLWEHGPMAARDVYAALPAGHGWAIKTLKTLLARLVVKGAVEYEQIGNSYLYRPACSREQVTRQEMQGFIERVLGGSIAPLLAHFIEEQPLSQDELARLKEVFDKKVHRIRKEKNNG